MSRSHEYLYMNIDEHFKQLINKAQVTKTMAENGDIKDQKGNVSSVKFSATTGKITSHLFFKQRMGTLNGPVFARKSTVPSMSSSIWQHTASIQSTAIEVETTSLIFVKQIPRAVVVFTKQVTDRNENRQTDMALS